MTSHELTGVLAVPDCLGSRQTGQLLTLSLITCAICIAQYLLKVSTVHCIHTVQVTRTLQYLSTICYHCNILYSKYSGRRKYIPRYKYIPNYNLKFFKAFKKKKHLPFFSKFDCRRLTLGPKKTVEAWFHNLLL